MIYEELKIKLDLYDSEDVLKSVGGRWNDCLFVVCDDGDCHLFKTDGTEDDIIKVDKIVNCMIRKDIKKIVIPDSVTSIWDYTFLGCSELISVMIPDSITSIGSYVFGGSKELISVVIPDSVTSIGPWAFSICSKLKSLIFKGKTLDKVKTMDNYPWGIDDESIIKCV